MINTFHTVRTQFVMLKEVPVVFLECLAVHTDVTGNVELKKPTSAHCNEIFVMSSIKRGVLQLMFLMHHVHQLDVR